MRARVLLVSSLVLNAVLVIAWLKWGRAPQTPPRVVRAINPAALSNAPIRVVKTNILVRPRLFHWREVESSDYAIYIENLREIGCPESTVRDIIVADVNLLFARKRRDEASAQDMEWWRLDASQEKKKERDARAAALESERREMLVRLLGPNWPDDADANRYLVVLAGPVLSVLPAETKKAVQDAVARTAEQNTAYFAELHRNGDTVDETKVAKFREETRAQLAKLLTPPQLEEFLLRYSYNANRLREQLSGFEVTPDEFRKIFRDVDDIDHAIQLKYSGDDAEAQKLRKELEQQRQLAVKNALGPQRYEQYRTALDPNYKEAQTLAEQAGVPLKTGLALQEINQAVTEEKQRIQTDPALTEEQKAAELKLVEQQQAVARAVLLGQEPPPNAEGKAAPSPVISRAHQVAPGETLAHIALRYGVRMSAIRELNPDVDFTRVRPGDPLNIPPPAPPVPPVPPFPKVR